MRIVRMAHGGAGVGRPEAGDGRTWLVEGALPGEMVEAVSEHAARTYVRGRIVRVVDSSPERRDPPCAYVGVCGGCDLQHVAPGAQLALKVAVAAGQLRRPCGELATGPGSGLAYRRTARMHYRREGGGLRLGLYGRRSRELVDIGGCVVLVPVLDRAFQSLRRLAGLLPVEGEALGLSDGRMAVLGLPGVRPTRELADACKGLLVDGLVGIELRGGRQRQVFGRTRIEVDEGGDLPPLLVDPFVFVQANAEANRVLVAHVSQMARAPGKRVLELFAGAGNLTRPLAAVARRVLAVDEDRHALALIATMAARRRQPVTVRHGLVARVVAGLAGRGTRYDVCVLDPPRQGLGAVASRALARVVRERIVYVSCDPATLARDLAAMAEGAFAVEDVRVLDMMPMTSEVEIVATLARVQT